MRIDLGDMEGYIMAGQGEEEEERRLEEELEGREARLEEELDLQAAEQGEEVCKVARPVSGRHPDHRHLLHPAPGPGAGGSGGAGRAGGRDAEDPVQGVRPAHPRRRDPLAAQQGRALRHRAGLQVGWCWFSCW